MTLLDRIACRLFTHHWIEVATPCPNGWHWHGCKTREVCRRCGREKV